MPPARGYQTMEASSTAVDQMRPPKLSQKRKRDSPEHNGTGRSKTSAGQQGSSAGANDGLDNLLLGETDDLSHISQQLLQHSNRSNNTAPSTAAAALAARLTVPQPTDISFQSTTTVNDEEPMESSFEMSGVDGNSNSHAEGTPYNLDAYSGNGATTSQQTVGIGTGKPTVGSEEWHKVRKDNHKEGSLPVALVVRQMIANFT